MKQCSKCKKEKEEKFFYRDPRNKSGLAGRCKECVKEYNKLNKAARSIYNKKWNARNKDKLNELRKARVDTVDGKFLQYKYSAKRLKRKFSLNKNQFSEIVNSKCYYCGEGELLKKLVGVDRIDSSKGYKFDNCVPCCSKCNRMKMADSMDDFLIRIAKIYKVHYGKKKT